ncbi:MAG: XRE family transcriptional regulator [Pseudobutyrivibrio sp.]|nr:XRE family transcriptional regulator [Pseudobutyrivibrio sp.]
MSFSYKPLWKLLIDSDMSKKELMRKVNISKSTVDKMGRGQNISMEIIDKLCNYFDCSVSDVIMHIKTEDKE